MIKTITGDSFQKEVLQSEIPILVDFWAEGCGPCETVASMLEKLNQEQAASKKISTIKIDVMGKINLLADALPSNKFCSLFLC